MLEKNHPLPQASENLITKVTSFITKHHLIEPKSTIIVGLSGGPDSVCLLSVLKKLQPQYELRLIAAHLDHQWRTNSHEDARACQQFAQALNVEYREAQASTIKLTKKYNGSLEEKGRHMRRTFFESIAREYNAQTIALAHHQDDQQETFFIRMIRGASITGLASIRPQQGIYIRPLLTLHKHEIIDYLEKERLTYIHDITNESNAHLRNALRHQVIPALKSCDDRFDKTFYKTIEQIQQTEQFLEQLTQKTFNTISTKKNGTHWIDCDTFLNMDPFLHPRLILHWLSLANVPFTPSTAFFNEITRFLKNPGLHHEVHTNWYILKKAGSACIIKR